jgi:CheY-like chemotaxis protein
MVADLSCLLTQGARDVLPRLRQRKIACLFEDHACDWIIYGDHDELQRCLHRVLLAAASLLSHGVLSIQASAVAGRLQLHIGGTGRLCSAEQLSLVLDEMGVLDAKAGPTTAGGVSRLRRGSGRCPASGVEVRFSSLAPAAFLFDFDYPLKTTARIAAATQPHAPRPWVWIIDADPLRGATLSRQATRHGWQPQLLSSLMHALQRLDGLRGAPPSLVLLCGADGLRRDRLHTLRRQLPDATRCVLAVDPGSLWLGDPQALPGIDIAGQPFGGADWRRWRDGLDGADALPSPLRRTGPVLIVDDDPVARQLAQAMTEHLGHAVASAPGGAEAIELCRAEAPTLVLMDLQMPGLDGFETTRQLREMQRRGEVAPFAIVALSASHDEVSVRAAMRSGVDAFVGKPLQTAALRTELYRWGHAADPLDLRSMGQPAIDGHAA